ncbi:acyltransferase [Desulfosporosinus sp. Sb-LF]|uniref:acyltransferase n=1 Tax=Desulfosporosinus sp. Sb-LF TaxID=2560027 RepID=UPI0018EE5EEE|nr:acyltransferase [Desulfosporosinus sp. Sb-LF]
MNRISQAKLSPIKEIHLLRGFGVLAVIAIHTSGYFTEIPRFNTLVLVNLWTDIFSQFAVPLFVFISGFVLTRNYSSNFLLSEFYQKRVRSIVPQYLIFSVAYTVFNNWEVMQSNLIKENGALLFKNILHSDASYHLWFFSIIIQFYIVYPLILRIYNFFKQQNRVELLLAVFLILQTLWMEGLHTNYFGVLKINFIAYLFYFGMGMYSSNHFERLRNSLKGLTPIFLTISLVLTIGVSFFIIIGLKMGYRYNEIPAYFLMGAELIFPILRISTFLLLFNLARNLVGKRNSLEKAIYKLGDYSFGIYLIHIFFNQYAIRILRNHSIGYSNWIFYPLVFSVTLIISYLAVRLISYLPISYYVIGHRVKLPTNKKIQ